MEVGCGICSLGAVQGVEGYIIMSSCVYLYEVECAWIESSYAPVYTFEYEVQVDRIVVVVVAQLYDYLSVCHWVQALDCGWGIVSFSSVGYYGELSLFTVL